jgi:hypothetical protein
MLSSSKEMIQEESLNSELLNIETETNSGAAIDYSGLQNSITLLLGQTKTQEIQNQVNSIKLDLIARINNNTLDLIADNISNAAINVSHLTEFQG